MNAIVLPHGPLAAPPTSGRASSAPTHAHSAVAGTAAPLAGSPGLRHGAALAEPPASSRGTGLAVVVAVHLLIGWALASGLARQAIEIVKKPIQTTLIAEAAPPPPKPEKLRDIPKAPPPPAYVALAEVTPAVVPPAPVITAVQNEPPKEPVVIAPPAPPAPAPVESRPAPVKQEISLACPGYQAVLAEMLEEAVDRVGLVGIVRSRLTVRGNQVVEAVPVSGPKEYFKYVQAAVKRMHCSAGGADEVQVVLDVRFQK